MEEQKQLERHGLYYAIGYLKGLHNTTDCSKTKKFIKALFNDLNEDYKVNENSLKLKDNE